METLDKTIGEKRSCSICCSALLVRSREDKAPVVTMSCIVHVCDQLHNMTTTRAGRLMYFGIRGLYVIRGSTTRESYSMVSQRMCSIHSALRKGRSLPYASSVADMEPKYRPRTGLWALCHVRGQPNSHYRYAGIIALSDSHFYIWDCHVRYL